MLSEGAGCLLSWRSDGNRESGVIVLFEESCAYCLPLFTVKLEACDLVLWLAPREQALDVGGVGRRRSGRSRKGWSAQLALTHDHFR